MPRLSVAAVVPAHRDSPELRRSLAALRDARPPPDELVLVLDGVGTGDEAALETLADRVLRLERAHGPARARNAGAAATDSDVLLFVDADVAVRPDAVGVVLDHLERHPDVDAAIGLYEPEPGAEGVLTRYKALLNHHVHATARLEAETFWSGLGAIRRTSFTRAGGFDESYTRPSVEDIELGYRLRDAGARIHLLKGMRATHLKRWTARSLLVSDVRDRALPWSLLILGGRGFHDDLNIARAERLKAAAAVVTAVAVPASVAWRPAAGAAGAGLAVLGVLDRRLVRLFAEQGGLRFAAAATAWHWFSYVYASAAFAFAAVARERPARAAQRRERSHSSA